MLVKEIDIDDLDTAKLNSPIDDKEIMNHIYGI